MFKWFIKPKLDYVAIVQEARKVLNNYLEHGEHSLLIPVFRRSLIERADQKQYLMTEIHIGSLMQQLKRVLYSIDIDIYELKPTDPTRLNTIFIRRKHITDVPTAVNILVTTLAIRLGYEGTKQHHLPFTLGRFISESSKI